ncbi:MAG: class I SAM-dependent methyltransferase [Phycisphaerae bacterium]|nr:class I SAM-dependent methyltransferase [Phycisphaerae bacterium]
MNDAVQHFDEVAEDYDTLIPRHVRDHYLRKRVKVIGRLLDGGVGLDVGCGTGLLMEALTPYGKVSGVDASAGMIRVLTEAGRGEALQAPSDSLPFGDGRFDVVFCVAVLHHVADPARVRKTIHEMVRVAKPSGGRVLIWDHNPRNPYWPIIMKRVPQDTGRERIIPAAEIERALSQAGAREVRTVRSGFVPDFVPRCLMPIAVLVEAVVERTPLLRAFCAHNIVIATR